MAGPRDNPECAYSIYKAIKRCNEVLVAITLTPPGPDYHCPCCVLLKFWLSHGP